MNLDLNLPVFDLAGDTIPASGNNEAGEVLTLRIVIQRALLAEIDPKASAEDKVRRFHLALAVQSNSSIRFSTEEAALIKKRVGETMGALVVGRVYDMMDPPEPVPYDNAIDI